MIVAFAGNEKVEDPIEPKVRESQASESGGPPATPPVGSQMSARAMTVEYLLVLGAMAVILVARYWVTIRHIDRQMDDAYLVNLSGRQRMLSQRIAALAQRLSLNLSKTEREEARGKLKAAISSMEISHSVLTKAGAGGVPPELPSPFREIYHEPPHRVDERLRRFLRDARKLADDPGARPSKGEGLVHLRLASSSDKLLHSLEAAVDQYQAAGEARVAGLKVLQKRMTVAILIVLVFIGGVVFRPMVDRISREHAALEELNRTLERRVLERSRQIEEFRDRYYHGVNHELRTPITCINAAFHALVDDFPKALDPRQIQLLDIALRNAGRLTAMIDDLLSLTSAETGKLSLDPVATALPGLIVETVGSLQLIASPKKIRLKADLPRALPLVRADPQRLVQVLTNLIGNAIKFTPEGGAITIRAAPFRDDPRFIQVSVADTGCGIPPEDQAKVFERLYQVAPRSSGHTGFGLGLYISKQIVDRHGGKLWVESAPGSGSVFFFTLPVKNSTAPA